MNVEVATLCDAATDNAGKLNILGAFDTIWVTALPAVHPQCAVALRLRFTHVEQGKHTVRIDFMDDDGHAVLPPLNAEINVAFKGEDVSVATNLILNIQRIKFGKTGHYSIDAAVDGRQEMSLPLFVRQRVQRKTAEN